jgi:hypothetical protein
MNVFMPAPFARHKPFIAISLNLGKIVKVADEALQKLCA